MLYNKIICKVLIIFIILQTTFKFCLALRLRLTKSTMPIHYDILIDTLLEKSDFQFTGVVTIQIVVEEVTDTIQLHIGPDMNVLSTELRLFGDLHETVEIKVEPLKEKEYWVITCNKLLDVGSLYEIKMEFESKLSNDNVGFYTTSYKNTNNGKLTWIAATNFKPIFARRAFPCYDEPDMKATFQLSLKYPDNLISTVMGVKIAYMSCGANGQMIATFEKTAKISTYQLGFALIDFPTELTNTTKGITITSHYRLICNRLLQEVAIYSPQLFEIAYNEFNGDKTLPTPKGSEIIQVMIPYNDTEDTSHWNIIFYREQSLYYNSVVHNVERFNNMLILIAQSMIYQWFSYTTPQWWNDFWISEGISIYYAYKNSHSLFPNNGIIEQFQLDVLHTALEIDSVRYVISLTNYFLYSDDIFEAYTFYRQKAPCIIRMMRFALNDACFQAAIENIFTNKQNDNFDTKYFYEMFDLALVSNGFSNINTKDTFESWFIENGYPMVNVTIKGTTIYLTQVHFHLDGSTDKNMWKIPINYITPNITLDKTNPLTPRFWLKTAEMTQGITEKGFNGDKHWVLVNIDQFFYYRVNYDENNWKLIIAQLNKKHTDFSIQTRAQLIDDAFNIAKAGYLKYEILEQIIDYIKNEKDPHPLKVFRREVQDFQKGEIKPEYRAAFKKLAKKIDSIQLNLKKD